MGNNKNKLTQNQHTTMVQAAGGSLKEQIEAEIKDTKVLVYSKSYCPYAGATKDLLKTKGIDAKIIELDKVDNGAQIQSPLKDITGQGTVPNVFINGNHIGGNSDMQALEQKGELQKKVDG